MSLAILFAATLPGLVVLLTALAALEHIASRRRRRSVITGEHRPSLAATGLDVFSAAMLSGKDTELDHRDVAKRLRLDSTDGAPPNTVDLASGTAHIRLNWH